MMRVAIRWTMIVLALVFAIAGAGTVLCEMDCATGGHAEAAAAMSDSASGVATPHCDGERMDSSHSDMPMPHGSSGENTKHSSAHSHLRIVATVSAEAQISPALTLSNLAVTPVSFSSAILARLEANLRNNNSSPPIKSPPVFSSSVLRI